MKLPKELTTVTTLSKLLAMILFVSLPVVGFLLGMRHQQIISSPSIITNSPTPTPLAIPTVDPSITASWKTYLNKELNYTFKYPPDWKLNLQTGYTPLQLYSNDARYLLYFSDPYGYGDTPENNAKVARYGTNVINESNIKIGGHKGIKLEALVTNSSTYHITIYLGDIYRKVIVNNKMEQIKGTLKIYYEIRDKAQIEEAKMLLYQILSTFKFTDQ